MFLISARVERRRESVEEGLVERSADRDADAYHCYGDFGGGPDDEAHCVFCTGEAMVRSREWAYLVAWMGGLT